MFKYSLNKCYLDPNGSFKTIKLFTLPFAGIGSSDCSAYWTNTYLITNFFVNFSTVYFEKKFREINYLNLKRNVYEIVNHYLHFVVE